MAKKLKFMYVAYELFPQLIKLKPMMTGCYQWIRVFDGDYANWHDLIKTREELEKYDAIMINMDWTDCKLVYELRDILGDSSSTKIVACQDHSPELWQTSLEFIQEFKKTMQTADEVFATTPTAWKLMQLIMGKEKNIHLSPHPCETHVLKRFRSDIQSNHMLVFWHRYDKFGVIPALNMTGIPIMKTLCGYIKSPDSRHRTVTSLDWRGVIPVMDFLSFIKLIKEAKMGYDAFTSYSVGRIGWDCAALGTPLIGSSRNWSSQVCYPLTSFDPYDTNGIRKAALRLLNDEGFYDEVKTIAKYNVEFAGHEQCKERFLTMMEGKA